MTETTYNTLTPEERYVIEMKGTERPFSGEYDDFYETGKYICRRCNADLYRSRGQVRRHVRLARVRRRGAGRGAATAGSGRHAH